MDDRIQLWNEFAAQTRRRQHPMHDGGRHRAIRPPRCPRRTSLAVLYADHLRTHVSDPDDPANDRFVLSKGHAAPVLYATLKAIGAISDEELLTLRRFGSPIQGHPAPVPELPWVDVATGSLGQGLADRRGDGVRDAARRLARTRLGADRGLRDGRRLGLGGHGGGVVPRGSTASPRSSTSTGSGSAAPRCTDGTPTCSATERRRSAGTRSRSTATTSPQIDAAYTRGEAADRPDDDRRTHGEGSRRVVPGQRGGMAREGAAGRAAGRRGDRGARRRAAPDDHAARNPSRSCPSSWATPRRRRATRLRRPDRDAQGVRRRARLARRSPSRPRGARRRGRQLHLYATTCRRSRRSASSRCTSPSRRMVGAQIGHAGARQDRVRGHVRGVLHAGRRLRADGRDRPGGPAALRLARGRLDRRGRPVADGARGSRDHARAERLDRAVPGGRQRHREARHRRCATSTGISYLRTHARGDARALRPRTRRSRSAAQDARVEPTTTGSTLVGAGVTLHQCLAAATSLARRGHRGRVIDCYSRQADRRADAASGARGDGRSSWSSRTTGSRAASATRCWTRSPRPVRCHGRVDQARRRPRCRARARRTSCARGPGSTQRSIVERVRAALA